MVDKEHLLRVAAKMDTLEEILVAILHDSIEDGYALDYVARARVTSAVNHLTRRENEPYAEYIRHIKGLRGPVGELVRKVKIADLEDNLVRSRGTSLERRYRLALMALLKQGLKEHPERRKT